MAGNSDNKQTPQEEPEIVRRMEDILSGDMSRDRARQMREARMAQVNAEIAEGLEMARRERRTSERQAQANDSTPTAETRGITEKAKVLERESAERAVEQQRAQEEQQRQQEEQRMAAEQQRRQQDEIAAREAAQFRENEKQQQAEQAKLAQQTREMELEQQRQQEEQRMAVEQQRRQQEENTRVQPEEQAQAVREQQQAGEQSREAEQVRLREEEARVLQEAQTKQGADAPTQAKAEETSADQQDQDAIGIGRQSARGIQQEVAAGQSVVADNPETQTVGQQESQEVGVQQLARDTLQQDSTNQAVSSIGTASQNMARQTAHGDTDNPEANVVLDADDRALIDALSKQNEHEVRQAALGMDAKTTDSVADETEQRRIIEREELKKNIKKSAEYEDKDKRQLNAEEQQFYDDIKQKMIEERAITIVRDGKGSINDGEEIVGDRLTDEEAAQLVEVNKHKDAQGNEHPQFIAKDKRVSFNANKMLEVSQSHAKGTGTAVCKVEDSGTVEIEKIGENGKRYTLCNDAGEEGNEPNYAKITTKRDGKTIDAQLGPEGMELAGDLEEFNMEKFGKNVEFKFTIDGQERTITLEQAYKEQKEREARKAMEKAVETKGIENNDSISVGEPAINEKKKGDTEREFYVSGTGDKDIQGPHSARIIAEKLNRSGGRTLGS